jgi:hypothetical protein
MNDVPPLVPIYRQLPGTAISRDLPPLMIPELPGSAGRVISPSMPGLRPLKPMDKTAEKEQGLYDDLPPLVSTADIPAREMAAKQVPETAMGGISRTVPVEFPPLVASSTQSAIQKVAVSAIPANKEEFDDMPALIWVDEDSSGILPGAIIPPTDPIDADRGGSAPSAVNDINGANAAVANSIPAEVTVPALDADPVMVGSERVAIWVPEATIEKINSEPEKVQNSQSIAEDLKRDTNGIGSVATKASPQKAWADHADMIKVSEWAAIYTVFDTLKDYKPSQITPRRRPPPVADIACIHDLKLPTTKRVSAAIAILQFLGFGERPSLLGGKQSKRIKQKMEHSNTDRKSPYMGTRTTETGTATATPNRAPSSVPSAAILPASPMFSHFSLILMCPHEKQLRGLIEQSIKLHMPVRIPSLSISQSDVCSPRVSWLASRALLPDGLRLVSDPSWMLSLDDPYFTPTWWGVAIQSGGADHLTVPELQALIENQVDPCGCIPGCTRPAHEWWSKRCLQPLCRNVEFASVVICPSCFSVTYCSTDCANVHKEAHAKECHNFRIDIIRQDVAKRMQRSASALSLTLPVPSRVQVVEQAPPARHSSGSLANVPHDTAPLGGDNALASLRRFTTYTSVPALFLSQFAAINTRKTAMEAWLTEVIERSIRVKFVDDLVTTAQGEQSHANGNVNEAKSKIEANEAKEFPPNRHLGTIAGFIAKIAEAEAEAEASVGVKAATQSSSVEKATRRCSRTDILHETWFVELMEIQCVRAFFRSQFVDHEHAHQRAPDYSSCAIASIGMRPSSESEDDDSKKIDALPPPANPVQTHKEASNAITLLERYPLDPVSYDLNTFCVGCGVEAGGGRECFPQCPDCGIRNSCTQCLSIIHEESFCAVIRDLIRRGILRTRYRYGRHS